MTKKNKPSMAELMHKEQKRLADRDMKLLCCRAGRLLRKGKPFVVVACDEPYYLDVYRLIRQHEKAKGEWSEYDEECFMGAVNQPVDTSIRWEQPQ